MTERLYEGQKVLVRVPNSAGLSAGFYRIVGVLWELEMVQVKNTTLEGSAWVREKQRRGETVQLEGTVRFDEIRTMSELFSSRPD